MRWYYKLIEKTPSFYRYAYSRESKDYDGEIYYFIATKTSRIEKPCENDVGDINEYSRKVALRKFESHVVDAEFPQEISVCCG